MLRLCAIAACAASLGLATLGTPRPASAQPADRASIDRAIAAVYPSLVRISVVAVDHADGREIRAEATGSGTIVSTDGLVVTNHHVAGRTTRIVCTLSNQEETPADLVGTDALADLAVLRLKPPTPRSFPAARFGRSSAVTRGQPVLAMGSPLSFSQSVTLGVISNTGLIMPNQARGLTLDGENVGSIVRWLGHDAAIFPGNSGGPLVNLAGEIVGVNEVGFGLAGAIPSDLAVQVVEALARDGRVRRSWLGFEIQPLLREGASRGALVAWVEPDSPAEAAGLKAGDEVISVGGVPTDARFAEQLPDVNQRLLSLPIGKAVDVVVWTAPGERRTSIVPIERGAARERRREWRAWGLVSANLSPIEAREMGRVTREGALVVSVRPGGPAATAQPALAPGDMIVEVDGRAVLTSDDLAPPADGAPRDGVLVTFERGLERRLTVVRVGAEPVDGGGVQAARAWLPVVAQVLTPPLAERLGFSGRTGVRIARVTDATCGLRVGDLVFAIDGEPLSATNAGDEGAFFATIGRYRIGSTVSLTVVRDRQEQPLAVTLIAAPRPARDMPRYTDTRLEFVARNLAEGDRDGQRITPATQGVVVESVSRGGWADVAQLRAGDIIVAIGSDRIPDVKTLEATLVGMATAKPRSILVQVRRGVRTRFLEIEPAWP